MEKKKLSKNFLGLICFYIIVGFTGIFVLPILGVIAPTFILCGIIIPIAGFIELFGYIFNFNIPFVNFQIGAYTMNPILGFLLSITTGIILYFIGIGSGKLLLKYIHKVKKEKQKLYESQKTEVRT